MKIIYYCICIINDFPFKITIDYKFFLFFLNQFLNRAGKELIYSKNKKLK